MKTLFGMIVLAVALAACGQAQEKQHDMPAPRAQDAARTDADFGLRLGLIEGHLMVGRELLQAGQTQNSLPHFGHPVRELYSDMLPVIASRGGQQFDRDLIALEGLAAQGNTPAFATAFDAALAKVHAARALIPAETWNSDAYILGVAADTVSVASQEYRNAIVSGKIDSLIEYHDARGFLFYLSALLANHHGSDPRLTQVSTIVNELKGYLAPLDPPSTPPITDAAFEAQAEDLRQLVKASE